MEFVVKSIGTRAHVDWMAENPGNTAMSTNIGIANLRDINGRIYKMPIAMLPSNIEVGDRLIVEVV